MLTDAKHGLHECRRIIWEDIYLVRKYREDYFDFIFDIGAHIGVFSVFMRMRHPNAKMIAVEPCKETQKYLYENLQGLNVQIEKRALGNGKPLFFSPGKISVSHRFVEEAPNAQSYMVESITLDELFEKSGCQSADSYMLKIDCEGGEKYCVGNKRAESIIRNAKHVSIEVHFNIFDDWLKWDVYKNWIQTFASTHSIGYHFSSKKVGCGNYILERLGRKHRYG